VRIFHFTIASRQALGPNQPTNQWVPVVLSLRVKRPGRPADNSPPSSAKVKSAWSYSSTPPYAFTAWRSVKAQGQLYLYLYLYFEVLIDKMLRSKNYILKSRNKLREFHYLYNNAKADPNMDSTRIPTHFLLRQR